MMGSYTPEQAADFLRRNPGDEHRLEAAFQPTFSAGGRGGDADTNADGIADPGWSQGSGGQWAYSKPGSLASLLAPTSPQGPQGNAGTPMPRTGNPMLDALIQQAFAPTAPVSTTMPVGGQPQLSALLRY